MPITRSLPLCRRTFVNDLAFNLIMDCGQAMLANGGEVFRAAASALWISMFMC